MKKNHQPNTGTENHIIPHHFPLVLILVTYAVNKIQYLCRVLAVFVQTATVTASMRYHGGAVLLVTLSRDKDLSM